MKCIRLLYIVLALWCTTGCSKYNDPVKADSGCIGRISQKADQNGLSPDQLNAVNQLFTQNNISTSDLQFLYFFPSIHGDTAKVKEAQVSANLFVNGLPVFRYTEAFDFTDGVFDTAYLYTGAPSNADTVGHRSLSSLRDLFLVHISEAITYMPFGNKIIPARIDYENTCLTATLGYLDAAYLPGSTKPWGRLLKVWSVIPAGKGGPEVLVEDEGILAWGEPVYIP